MRCLDPPLLDSENPLKGGSESNEICNRVHIDFAAGIVGYDTIRAVDKGHGPGTIFVVDQDHLGIAQSCWV